MRYYLSNYGILNILRNFLKGTYANHFKNCKKILFHISLITLFIVAGNQLTYFDLNISASSIPLQVLGHFDDGASDAINIFGDGFPFGDTRHNYLFVRS